MEREIEVTVTGMGRVKATVEEWKDAGGQKRCYVKSAVYAGTDRPVPEMHMDFVRQQIGC